MLGLEGPGALGGELENGVELDVGRGGVSAFVVGSVFPNVPTFSVRFPEESPNGAGDPSDFQRINGEEGYSIERSSAVPTAVVEADRGVFGKKIEVLDQDPLSNLGTILGWEHGQ